MDLETNPPQPQQVSAAICGVLAAEPEPPDPWWQAGIEESLEPADE